ncbi:HXXXD-type acyl-transferase family protein [Rhynchospora pubera]|uniref:HXXXD-type acyl-transferase family protein n=1 Tax=Rhynchospora pubera TaxID=906938 RepID=A0AAV8FSJ7_9POAL|nr:HXXXD-type acyl-transferase family protein [Rhynchospora pubera]
MPFFHPFAGKLAYIPSDARAVIDCSASAISEGITFIEAESDLDIHCIAKSEVHESFGQLVPKVKLEFPIVVLAVQVTRFLNGGMALGFSLHHVVADGKGKLQFIEALASISRVLVTVVNVRGLANDDGPFIGTFPADCRSRLNPPINDEYIGNCVAPCIARMTASDIAGPGGYVRACVALKEAIIKTTKEPLDGCEGWLDELLKLPAGRMANFAGSPQFKVYETDFGWGKPGRVELATMTRDGRVVIVSGKEEGTVQVSVALNAQHMWGRLDGLGIGRIANSRYKFIGKCITF